MYICGAFAMVEDELAPGYVVVVNKDIEGYMDRFTGIPYMEQLNALSNRHVQLLKTEQQIIRERIQTARIMHQKEEEDKRRNLDRKKLIAPFALLAGTHLNNQAYPAGITLRYLINRIYFDYSQRSYLEIKNDVLLASLLVKAGACSLQALDTLRHPHEFWLNVGLDELFNALRQRKEFLVTTVKILLNTTNNNGVITTHTNLPPMPVDICKHIIEFETRYRSLDAAM
jgi:hypothetical protein